MSDIVFQRDVFCVAMSSIEDPVRPGANYQLEFSSLQGGGKPLLLAVTEQQYDAVREPFICGQLLTLTVSTKGRVDEYKSEITAFNAGKPTPNRFDEEKPPTPAASRCEPDSDE